MLSEQYKKIVPVKNLSSMVCASWNWELQASQMGYLEEQCSCLNLIGLERSSRLIILHQVYMLHFLIYCRASTPPRPNSFIIMQFLGNFGKIVCWRLEAIKWRIGRSKGARGTRAPGSKFFQFHAVLGEIWQNRMLAYPLESWRLNLGEILDPQLHFVYVTDKRKHLTYRLCGNAQWMLPPRGARYQFGSK